MTDILNALQSHRSIRKFQSTPIPAADLEQILLSAQAASTSSNLQAYSVVTVQEPGRRARLAELAGNQAYIEESPLFLVWLADLNKLRTAVKFHEDVELQTNTELFLLASIDAALAAQNAAVASEALGYGIVYIGGIRNNPREVSDLLELPPLVYPVFGMSVGVPDQEPDLRPRLPLGAVVHSEVYRQEELETGIRAYDETTREYYAKRKGGPKFGETVWSREVLRRLEPGRLRGHLHGFLSEQGFELK
ncbi:oxygen-insensitive NADPH nitroreductase [Paenibacillus mucilaginosus]|uniref:Nitroreductase n=3 Tax=Paenibacillus mucilaginosus TaxID=61624 RepID=H6NFU0_9BACL|nr:oxygen-insensitive NADPH nitroreductase [Paenibacillus mucilaginosus]AEI43044.1 nitroreductase [Paenibacillus mucilaginosus KNP414]AFC30730.1 nitroreductase [Paenibacillus mucilaginosus 3016]AFH63049.1 FMN reductase [Paenibacillus mucilaginosus K02]MCG7215983.1 oxygen-insensitive NADPH nitroreductase [Paenibacillus mucilaginosus]WDM31292.1 oxygen-insensitive NADPH nitroreductase [Paenibacillus mucilaginosus]